MGFSSALHLPSSAAPIFLLYERKACSSYAKAGPLINAVLGEGGPSGSWPFPLSGLQVRSCAYRTTPEEPGFFFYSSIKSVILRLTLLRLRPMSAFPKWLLGKTLVFYLSASLG